MSDVVAYPTRVVELLERWCAGGWAARMVVTMKFQGGAAGGGPDWAAIDRAAAAAAERGYACRAKHFFANKNEVTLMLRREAEG